MFFFQITNKSKLTFEEQRETIDRCSKHNLWSKTRVLKLMKARHGTNKKDCKKATLQQHERRASKS